jgi:hypothetical protein
MFASRSITLAVAALASTFFDCTFAEPARAKSAKACSTISKQELASCNASAKSDKAIALARCANLADPSGFKDCKTQATSDTADALSECKDQRDLRATLCAAIGEAPYAPPIDPNNFTSTIDNPFFPLVPGTTFIYEGQTAGGLEHDEFAVTHNTKLIMGVTCVEVHDVVKLNGDITEDTRDWFAQDATGNVWYFGENSQVVENGLPVSLEGSWTAGVDGAQPGIIIKASPTVDDTYRNEFSVGVAEDFSTVKSLTDSVMVPFGTFNNDAVRTEDGDTLAPGDVENKFYVSGTGNVLTVDVATGERSELISITTGN